MADPNLVDRYEQAAQELQSALGDILVEMERLKDLNKYLSEKLTETHQYSSHILSERNTWQVKYEVLRDVSLGLCRIWGNGNDEERLQRRMREVLGLTTETQPFEAQEEEAPAPYTLPFTPDNDEVPDEETNF